MKDSFIAVILLFLLAVVYVFQTSMHANMHPSSSCSQPALKSAPCQGTESCFPDLFSPDDISTFIDVAVEDEEIERTSKRPRVSKREDAERKLSRASIAKELQNFVCCQALRCWTWLTVTMVWYCRGLVVPLSYKRQREWVDSYLKENCNAKTGKITWEIMKVNEQLVNVGATKSCAAAFAFAHGLNIRTVE